MSQQITWLIGASEGIGAALAHTLAAEGRTLVVSARSVDKLEALVAELHGSGHRALPLDVTDDAAIQTAWKSLNNVGTVIYNAGVYDPMAAQQLDLAKARQMMRVNFDAALACVATVLPSFISKNYGHLVLVGSVAAYRGLPAAIGYGASKAAVKHLAENLAVDLQHTNIKVQLVSPGFVKTRLTDKNDFKMHFVISPEQAAKHIANGMKSARFEIHFPKRFSLIMKLLSILPHRLFLKAVA